MTEETPSTDKTAHDTPTPLRLWPAMVFMLSGLTVSLGIAQFGSTNNHNLIGMLIAPLLASILILLWWSFASRVSRSDRIKGVVLLALMLTIVYVTQQAFAPILLAVAIPYLVYGVVIVFALMRGRSWLAQRRLAILYLIACATVFSAIQVNSVAGDLRPDLSWRWASGLALSSVQSPGGVAELPIEIGADDWPAFRGAKRDSHLLGVTFSSDWTTPPKKLWRNRVGLGWSSFTIVGDYFFTQEQRGEYEAVVCYRAQTGEEIWINSIKAHYDNRIGPGPRSTPTYQDGKLYVQGATGIVQCIEAQTGTTIWKRDLTKDTKAKVPQWGFSGSPLIVGDAMIQNTGDKEDSSVIAYDKATGDVLWKNGKGKGGYSSPHFIQLADIPQVLVNNDFGIQSFTPDTGEVLWEHHWLVKSNPRVVQPLFTEDGGVLIGTAAGMGTRRLNLSHENDTWKVTEVWTTKRFRPYFNDYIIYEDYCYGFDGNRLMCIDVKTGEEQWKGDKRPGGQLLFVQDMELLLILTEKGEVMLVEAIPEQYTVVSQFKAISGKTWNHPVIAYGKLYVRNSEEMACFELALAK